jgi:hypothetical protein
MGMGVEIREPAAAIWKRNAADVDPAIEVVEDDLEPSRLAGLAAGGGDVDGLAALERRFDLISGRCPRSIGFYSPAGGSIPAESPCSHGSRPVSDAARPPRRSSQATTRFRMPRAGLATRRP